MHFWSHRWLYNDGPSGFSLFFGTEKHHTGPFFANMETGASLQCRFFFARNSRTSNEVWAGALLWRNSHEFFATNQGVFFELLHTNGVKLVGSTLYWPWCTDIHDKNQSWSDILGLPLPYLAYSWSVASILVMNISVPIKEFLMPFIKADVTCCIQYLKPTWMLGPTLHWKQQPQTVMYVSTNIGSRDWQVMLSP